MTYKEAKRIVAIGNQPTSRLFVEWAKLRQEPDSTCSVVIEPVDGEQQIHSEVEQAGWALSSLLADASKARFMELGCEPGSILWGLFMGEFQGR